MVPPVLARLKGRWFLLPVIGAAVLLVGCGSASKGPTTRLDVSGRPVQRRTAGLPAVVSLVVRPEGLLPAGVQFPATVAVDGRLLLMGGLDQATASVADVVLAGPGGSARIGTLPYAVPTQRARRLAARRSCSGAGSRPTVTSSQWTGPDRASDRRGAPSGRRFRRCRRDGRRDRVRGRGLHGCRAA